MSRPRNIPVGIERQTEIEKARGREHRTIDKCEMNGLGHLGVCLDGVLDSH